MSALLRFLARFAFVFEFLLLEVIAGLLIFNNNVFQQSVIYKLNASLVASVYQTTNSWTQYFSLRVDNERLAQENVKLANQVALLRMQLQTTPIVNPSTEAPYRSISAKVVYSSVNKSQNYILLDKGSADGVAIDMGVISSEGVVGIVQSVSKHFAVVLPIINTKLLVSSKLKSSGYLGSVAWDGLSPERASLTEIAGHVEAAIGDSVVTSGFSAIFPEGILIGILDDIDCNDHETFCTISVHLATRFQSLSYVRVIDYTRREEQKAIETPLH